MWSVGLFNQILRDLMHFISVDFTKAIVFLFSSVILFVNSRCSSLMLKQHLINHLIT